MLCFPLAIGIVTGLLSIWLTCFCLFNHVEVSESEIKSFNSFNQLAFQAPRKSVSIDTAPPIRGRYRLTSGRHSFDIYSSSNPCDRLALAKPKAPNAIVTSRPELHVMDTIYNCRTPSFYGITALILVMGFLIPVITQKWIGAIFPALLMPMFGLKIANERLLIGPNGVRYYDMFGKLKVSAPLADIQSVGRSEGSRNAYIQTKNGAILINQFPQTAQITSQVLKIIATPPN